MIPQRWSLDGDRNRQMRWAVEGMIHALMVGIVPRVTSQSSMSDMGDMNGYRRSKWLILKE